MPNYFLTCMFLFVTVLVDKAQATPLNALSCPLGQTVVAGENNNWNTNNGDVKRRFHAEFPSVSQNTPVGVIFSWHGVGDNIDNWRTHVPFADYSSREFPFIVITPEDTKLSVWGQRRGLAWDLFKSLPGDNNLEASLFESVLGCLAHAHKLDENRIYSAGFSGGAMVSNMLHARYPKLISAVFSGSGAWFSDAMQREAVHPPFGISIAMDWSPLRADDHGGVLMTYGGTDDSFGIFGLEILNFHDVGAMTKDYLRKHNRTAVVCEHDGGHQFHPALRIADIVKFFQAHTAGKASPIKTTADLPGVLKGICTVHAP